MDQRSSIWRCIVPLIFASLVGFLEETPRAARLVYRTRRFWRTVEPIGNDTVDDTLELQSQQDMLLTTTVDRVLNRHSQWLKAYGSDKLFELRRLKYYKHYLLVAIVLTYPVVCTLSVYMLT